ncbi:MAG: hypothetical protein ACI4UY_05470 [Kiritimatiellia bacterium]
MRTFLAYLLAVLLLAALAAAGVAGWMLWNENRRLRVDLAASEVQLAKITAERDQERFSLRQMTEAKESLGRNLVSTLKALDEAKGSLAGLKEDKMRVDAELALERRLAREKAEAEAKAAKERAAEAERAAQAEAARRRAEDPLADVGTLKQLLDLTDKAPRRAAD